MLNYIFDTCRMRRPPILRTKEEVKEKIALLEVIICNSSIKRFMAINSSLVRCNGRLFPGRWLEFVERGP